MAETRRRYPKRTKLTAVMAAEATSVAAASRKMGIPHTTIDYWFNQPEFVEYRNKTREERGELYQALSVKVISEIHRRLEEFEPRDLSVLLGILTDKGQLLSGQATNRTETLTSGMDDNERATLKRVISEAIA